MKGLKQRLHPGGVSGGPVQLLLRIGPQDTEPNEEEDKPEEKATLPWRALEAIQSAKVQFGVKDAPYLT